jgi:hypothetical protein
MGPARRYALSRQRPKMHRCQSLPAPIPSCSRHAVSRTAKRDAPETPRAVRTPARLRVPLAPPARLLHCPTRSGDAIEARRTLRCALSPRESGGPNRRVLRSIGRPGINRCSPIGGRSAPVDATSSPVARRCWRAGADPRARPDEIQARGQAGTRFTRGGVPINAPRRRRRPIIVPALPATEVPRITFGGAAGMCVAASYLRRAGPFPASLSSRPTPRPPSGAAPNDRVAHRSPILNDQAHADRRHPRGRNPRGGAGR